jgi:hypothetical protein
LVHRELKPPPAPWRSRRPPGSRKSRSTDPNPKPRYRRCAARDRLSRSVNMSEQEANRNAVADSESQRRANIRTARHRLVEDAGLRLQHDHRSSLARGRDATAPPILHQPGQPIMPADWHGTAVDALPARSYPPDPGMVAGQAGKGFRWHTTIHDRCRDCHR